MWMHWPRWMTLNPITGTKLAACWASVKSQKREQSRKQTKTHSCLQLFVWWEGKTTSYFQTQSPFEELRGSYSSSSEQPADEAVAAAPQRQHSQSRPARLSPRAPPDNLILRPTWQTATQLIQEGFNYLRVHKQLSARLQVCLNS